jgi:hypothetical protein
MKKVVLSRATVAMMVVITAVFDAAIAKKPTPSAPGLRRALPVRCRL